MSRSLLKLSIHVAPLPGSAIVFEAVSPDERADVVLLRLLQRLGLPENAAGWLLEHQSRRVSPETPVGLLVPDSEASVELTLVRRSLPAEAAPPSSSGETDVLGPVEQAPEEDLLCEGAVFACDDEEDVDNAAESASAAPPPRGGSGRRCR